MIQKSFPGHKGRPGKRGGSVPRGAGGGSVPSGSVTVNQFASYSRAQKVEYVKKIGWVPEAFSMYESGPVYTGNKQLGGGYYGYLKITDDIVEGKFKGPKKVGGRKEYAIPGTITFDYIPTPEDLKNKAVQERGGLTV